MVVRLPRHGSLADTPGFAVAGHHVKIAVPNAALGRHGIGKIADGRQRACEYRDLQAASVVEMHEHGHARAASPGGRIS